MKPVAVILAVVMMLVPMVGPLMAAPLPMAEIEGGYVIFNNDGPRGCTVVAKCDGGTCYLQLTNENGAVAKAFPTADPYNYRVEGWDPRCNKLTVVVSENSVELVFINTSVWLKGR